MTKRIFLRLAVIFCSVAVSSVVSAADLYGSYNMGLCVSSSESALLSQPNNIIKQTLRKNFENAKVGMTDPAVLGSRSPSLVWAMEARWACSAAIGYLEGGHLDPESVQKCDCFHQRYVSFR